MNQQAAKILKIQQELKTLKKQYKEANEEQCPPPGRTASHLEEEADDPVQSRMALYMPKEKSKETGCINRESLWLHQEAAGAEEGWQPCVLKVGIRAAPPEHLQ